MADLTPIITALLGGGLQGYQIGSANNTAKAKVDLEKSKAARESAKGEAEMLDKGLRYNEGTSKYEPYSDFYTPENAISPQQNTALDQAQMAAQAGGGMAPATANPYSPISTARANAALNVMPQGDPNQLRLQKLADMKRSEHAAPANKPGDALASDEATKAYEKAMGFPEGSMQGKLPVSLAGSGMSNVAGNLASAGRTNAVVNGAEKRTQAQIDAANARDQANRISREKIAADSLAAAKARGGKSRNAGQEVVNKKVGEDVASYVMGGGKAKNEADIKSIEEQIGRLKNYKRGMFSTGAAYLGEGAVDAVDPELASIRDAITNAMTGSAKENFPGRMTQSEFQTFIKNKFNPRLSPEENASRAERILNKMKSSAAARGAAADWFQSHDGDMTGFVAPPVDDSLNGIDEAPASSNIIDRSALYKKAEATGGKAVNGAVMPRKMVDGIRSMPTKGTLSKPELGAEMSKNGVNYVFNGKVWDPK